MRSEPRGPRWLLRRHFIVDRPFQLRAVARAVVLSVFLLVAILAGLLMPIVHDFESPGNDRATVADAATVFLHIHHNLWWIIVVSLLLPTLAAIHDSHRVAGPMVRVRRMLQALDQKRIPPRLTTRKHDWLKTEVALLNTAIERVDGHLRELRDGHAVLVASIRSALQDLPELRERFSCVEDAASRLGRALQEFQPPDHDRVATGAAAAEQLEPVAIETV
ncbi:MAG: hypothetical protein IPM29_26770 [Planctomycetes bacterium]|nr:hypothetical protein [Planctomycetota bacterium]